jgi:glycosyltransferase involved in cell wall biosynthesis
LADAVDTLIGDETLLQFLSSNAADDASRRFDLLTQVDAYWDWYREIVEGNGQRSLR